jgi:integrase
MPPEVRAILERRKSLDSREFVFCRADGCRFHDIQTGFDNALRRANIRDFHFHDLRHTAISYMIMNGIDLKTVAELVGHTTAQMVDKRYGHLSPDHKRTATDVFGSAMDRLCGRAPKPPAQAQA